MYTLRKNQSLTVGFSTCVMLVVLFWLKNMTLVSYTSLTEMSLPGGESLSLDIVGFVLPKASLITGMLEKVLYEHFLL